MTPKEAFKEIKCQYTHHECKQFPDDDMQIGVRFEEECKVVEQALTELEELKRYPTSDEVCEALQNDCKIITVIYDNGRFYDEDDGETVVSQFKVDGVSRLDFHDFIFRLDTILKIGRFYEGIEKK